MSQKSRSRQETEAMKNLPSGTHIALDKCRGCWGGTLGGHGSDTVGAQAGSLLGVLKKLSAALVRQAEKTPEESS